MSDTAFWLLIAVNLLLAVAAFSAAYWLARSENTDEELGLEKPSLTTRWREQVFFLMSSTTLAVMIPTVVYLLYTNCLK